MAITHHAIINYAKKDKTFYAVIGDDMAIASKIGAEKYKEVLRILGMDISIDKSIQRQESHNLAEIAKRMFVDGGEISPIPPDILINSTRNLNGFLEFMRIFSEKLHHSDNGGYSDSEYQGILSRLFFNSTMKDDFNTHVLLSCPFLKDFNILPSIPPITGIRSAWKSTMSARNLVNKFDQ